MIADVKDEARVYRRPRSEVGSCTFCNRQNYSTVWVVEPTKAHGVQARFCRDCARVTIAGFRR